MWITEKLPENSPSLIPLLDASEEDINRIAEYLSMLFCLSDGAEKLEKLDSIPFRGYFLARVGSLPLFRTFDIYYYYDQGCDGYLCLIVNSLRVSAAISHHTARYKKSINFLGFKNSIISKFLSSDLLGYLCSKKRTAFIIGDDRPTHFLTQTIPFLSSNSDFISGRTNIVLEDYCFLNPGALCPNIVYQCIPFSTLGRKTINDSLLYIRLYKLQPPCNNLDLAYLLSSRSCHCEEPGIIISLDIEKSRFLNQLAFYKYLLSQLDAYLSSRNKHAILYIDGWTVPFTEKLSDNDQKIIDRLDSLVSSLTSPAYKSLTFQSIYHLAIQNKYKPGIQKCYIGPKGTASLLPSLFLGIPCFTFGTSSIVYDHSGLPRLWGMRSSDDYSIPIKYIYDDEGSKSAIFHKQKYSISLDSIEEYFLPNIVRTLGLNTC